MFLMICFVQIGTLNAYNEKTIQNKFRIFYENMEHIETSYDVVLKDMDLVNYLKNKICNYFYF